MDDDALTNERTGGDGRADGWSDPQSGLKSLLNARCIPVLYSHSFHHSIYYFHVSCVPLYFAFTHGDVPIPYGIYQAMTLSENQAMSLGNYLAMSVGDP